MKDLTMKVIMIVLSMILGAAIAIIAGEVNKGINYLYAPCGDRLHVLFLEDCLATGNHSFIGVADNEADISIINQIADLASKQFPGVGFDITIMPCKTKLKAGDIYDGKIVVLRGCQPPKPPANQPTT